MRRGSTGKAFPQLTEWAYSDIPYSIFRRPDHPPLGRRIYFIFSFITLLQPKGEYDILFAVKPKRARTSRTKTRKDKDNEKEKPAGNGDWT